MSVKVLKATIATLETKLSAAEVARTKAERQVIGMQNAVKAALGAAY